MLKVETMGRIPQPQKILQKLYWYKKQTSCVFFLIDGSFPMKIGMGMYRNHFFDYTKVEINTYIPLKHFFAQLMSKIFPQML